MDFWKTGKDREELELKDVEMSLSLAVFNNKNSEYDVVFPRGDWLGGINEGLPRRKRLQRHAEEKPTRKSCYPWETGLPLSLVYTSPSPSFIIRLSLCRPLEPSHYCGDDVGYATQFTAPSVLQRAVARVARLGGKYGPIWQR